MRGVSGFGNGGVIVLQIGAVGIETVPKVGNAHLVAGVDAVVELAGEVVTDAVGPHVEAVAGGVQSVTHQGIVDLAGRRNLRQPLLPGGIDARERATTMETALLSR